MPLISDSTYRAPVLFTNAHVQTVFPSLFRKVRGVKYRRESIDTSDGDFLDVDWSRVNSDRAAIITHGLEGDSERAYVRGMVKALNRGGWDAAALNFRGCSGRPNRKLRSYHSGETGDLDLVVSHVRETDRYREIALVGFSLGGNVALKYAGERAERIDPLVKKLVAFSVPCDLESSAHKICEPGNRLYLKRFLRLLRKKIRAKMELMPGSIDDQGYDKIRSFQEFDDRYTAPINGFADALDYWHKCSCKPFLPSIAIRALLISAADDPFLPGPCYPVADAESSPWLLLDMPRHGGHVGFVEFNARGEYWSESRALSFLNES